MTTKRVLVGIVAGLLLAAAPVASYAAPSDSDSYVTPPKSDLEPLITDPCGTSHVQFPAGYWVAGESVDFAVSGPFQTRYDTPLAAAADGSLYAEFQAPLNGVGVYNMTFSAASRTFNGSVNVTQDIFDNPECQTGQAASTGSAALAATGSDIPLWALGTGAGLLAAGAVVVGVGAMRRRRES